MKLDPSKAYKIMAPRPVILVSTISPKGISNAAPFSFAMPVSITPPLMAFASDPAHDTVKNILKTKDFVINIPAKNILNKMYLCKKSFPYGVSEAEQAGLTEIRSAKVKSHRIKECFAQFECRLYQKVRLGDHLLIVGKVVAAWLDDKLFKDGKFQVKRAKGLMHIGSDEFGLLGEIVRAKQL